MKYVTVGSIALIFVLSAVMGWAALDDTLKQAIEHRLNEEQINGVAVDVTNESVTLAGEVESLWARERAESIALDNQDVQLVVNQLEIGPSPGDAELSQDIADRLSRYVHYSIFDDVNVAVRNNIVTLSGRVTWGFKKQEMEKLAARMAGVEQVINEIEVLPASLNDQQIRHSLAARIYGDPLLVRYSTQVVPPVHIIVENGRVTLTGKVNNNVQKRKAEILARETFGVFSVDNELEVSTS